MVVAAVILETISCLQYFSSRAAIMQEAEQRAKTELRKAELEIEKHTTEMETAAKGLALLAEKYVDCPDSVFAATHLAVRTMREYTSLAVAYVPDYFPEKGRYFEVCSSRITEDSVFTRQIGSESHDYTQMEWYQNGFVHDSCWWCEPYMDDSGSETMVVSCSYPVHDKNGKVVAVVCVDMALNYLQQKLPEYLRVYKNSYYSIRSSKGGDIVRVMDTIPGRKYNKYQEEIDATGWHIEIIIPEDELFADLNRIGIYVGILMILGLIVLALMLVYASHMIKKLVLSTEKNQRMESELQIASTIQTAMLPKIFPPFSDRSDLNIYGFVHPAKEIGGDLYDFYVRHDKLFFCVGDVSGKGVPAALVMAMTRSFFRSSTASEEQPAMIMRLMNQALVEQNTENMFLTLFIGVLDCKTGRLDYCNAGHNAPVLITSNDSPRMDQRQTTNDQRLKTNNQPQMIAVLPNLPLGIEPEFDYQAQTTQLQYNDVLFLYTDGLTEAENESHMQYGEKRMLQTLSAIGTSCPREIIQQIRTDVQTFVADAPQSDDLTLLSIRYQVPALVMRNDIQQIPTLAEWVDSLELPAEMNMQIQLALEEAVSNVMLYAYPEKAGQVLVEFAKTTTNDQRPTTYDQRPTTIVFTITDSGIPFDPTQQAEADTSLSAEERQIGGLGIHLVRQIMDEVRYERFEEKNILTLVKYCNLKTTLKI